jgi:signal transduction histidine kinase
MSLTGHENETPLPASVFNYSYLVLAILLLLSIGASVVFYQNSVMFQDESGTRWTPVVFLIGLCVSLLIFGMTHRDASARYALQRKTLDLISAQKENELLLEAEQASRIAAERANEAKNEFLALVSHELKTPLNAIAGWNRILKTKGLSDETRETAVEKIDKNLRLQAAIVEELLNFSDVMSSGFTTVGKNVNIREVFESAVSTVSVSAFQKGVSLVNEDLLEGEQVLGDPERLKLAMVNILSNAVKFTPAGGTVTAEAYRAEECVKCVIRDDGLGITPEFLPHVFEQYRQSDRPATRRYGGLGLGLTIADHIIKVHSGTIEAESQGVGGGATFTISLPVRK